jgi:3-hydroxybutyrate dehydrogenase
MRARGWGRIVNIASVHGLVASVNKAPYVAAKFGLVGLTRVTALEAAAAGNRGTGGVTANCICPGLGAVLALQTIVIARMPSTTPSDTATGILKMSISIILVPMKTRITARP